MFWVASPCWMWFLDASHCLRQCWYCYMVTFMTFNSWGLRQEARSADMEVPVLTLLSKQLQGELQFARYRQAHFTQGWQGKVTKFRKCSILYIYIIHIKFISIAEWGTSCWGHSETDGVETNSKFLHECVLLTSQNSPPLNLMIMSDILILCFFRLQALFLCFCLNRRLCVNFRW